ncbi:MAG: hypothetical protein A3G38_02965 [Omnitrophica WOR_2 bacterium RIFCSPLOWO2_12_FULL_51_8]|nr:MAG: hypothetical protein A3G38_02965 [Omnitrophica WOR_2 bacterium RIFCSPLOWO2_12_FULL_51_8]
MRLLAIDIGNTNITFGLFSAGKLARKFDLPTKSYNLRKLSSVLKEGSLVEACLVCSVAPLVTKILARDLRLLTAVKPYIIGKDIKVPIKNLYQRPGQVGQDRLVNAYAGLAFFQAPLVIIDFGTAITFDAVSKKGEYLGGLILPGLEISLEALSKRAALLPKIKLALPRELIGRDTAGSMLSGIIYGFASLSDGLSERIKQKIGLKAQVIGTGGNIRLMSKYCRAIDKVEQDLTLKGLKLIYDTIVEPHGQSPWHLSIPPVGRNPEQRPTAGSRGLRRRVK